MTRTGKFNLKCDKGSKFDMSRGVSLTFDNGYRVSIQWGSCNYGDNYGCIPSEIPTDSSTTAEVAVIGPEGGFVRHPEYMIHGDVAGYLTTKQVLEILVWAEQQENSHD